MSADLIDLVQRLGEPNILVVGDVMLDRYVWGNAERISRAKQLIPDAEFGKWEKIESALRSAVPPRQGRQ